VSDAELRTITADYTIEFARVLHNSSPNAAFSFLSGNGADLTGRSRLVFARYKGQAEKALLAAGFPRVYLYRPAYIYPVQPRKEPNFSYRLLRAVYPVFRLLFPNQVIRADELAWAMVDVCFDKHRNAKAWFSKTKISEPWSSRFIPCGVIQQASIGLKNLSKTRRLGR
jgi:uncharacterized protein YbjT (DUF2867 family)